MFVDRWSLYRGASMGLNGVEDGSCPLSTGGL